MPSPLQQFGSLKNSSDFMFVVFYRGHWCPFCIAYLKDLQSISSAITAANGTAVAITAESEDKLSKARERSGYDGVTIVDTENALATELKARGLLDVAISDKSGYTHGMAQPAVLVLRRDGTVLYQWAIVPGLMNMGGAKDRPYLPEVWKHAQAQLSGDTKMEKTAISKQSVISVLATKIFG